jgi:hypothetical protein
MALKIGKILVRVTWILNISMFKVIEFKEFSVQGVTNFIVKGVNIFMQYALLKTNKFDLRKYVILLN